MRIITGKARGMRLNVPKNYDVRPTADRVKESLFNIIGQKAAGARVLDLFSGSGNLGLEAWSRGASEIVFTDKSSESLKLTKSNIARLKAEKECRAIRSDAFAALRDLSQKGERFDLVFVDPPYNKGLVQRFLEEVAQHPILKDGGWAVLEHSAHDDISGSVPEGYQIFRNRKFGETSLSFLAAGEGEDPEP